MNIKTLIPAPVKLLFKLFKRRLFDTINQPKFANQGGAIKNFAYSFDKNQKIKQNANSASKKKNLIHAAKLIESIQIDPQEVFSFWRIVGRPTVKRGFEEGRTLINGKLEPSVGGGLCQLAGLIYYISLEANLEIIERHNHSVDIYTDETRYTPLGSDAAVVYGYKDLRIRNNLSTPIRFLFSISENNVDIEIRCTEEIEQYNVEFEGEIISDEFVEATTIVNGKEILKSKYKRNNDE